MNWQASAFPWNLYILQMPSDQGRKHPQQRLGGFLGLALNRAKSKSTEQLLNSDDQCHKLHKRVHSSRDLSVGAGFANVLAELNQQPIFKKSEENLAEQKEVPQSNEPKKCTVKYSDTVKKATMSVAVAVNSNTKTLASSALEDTDGNIDMEQAFDNIKMKLVSVTMHVATLASLLPQRDVYI